MRTYPPQMDFHRQCILPCVTERDVFAGTLSLGPAFDIAYIDDCAIQCVGHLVQEIHPDITYAEVSERLASETHTEAKATRLDSWIGSGHSGHSTGAILRVLRSLTETDYEGWELDLECTLRDFAFHNAHVPVMAVGTAQHVTAVKHGIVYDMWDARDSNVISVLLPAAYGDSLRGRHGSIVDITNMQDI